MVSTKLVMDEKTRSTLSVSQGAQRGLPESDGADWAFAG